MKAARSIRAVSSGTRLGVPILRQEIARPDLAHVADGGRHQAGVGGLAAQDHRADGAQDQAEAARRLDP